MSKAVISILFIAYSFTSLLQASKVVYLNNLENIKESDFYPSNIVPFANPIDQALYHDKIPNKFIPIEFDSKEIFIPPTAEPLDFIQFFNFYDSLANFKVKGYLAIPNDFVIPNHSADFKKYRLVVYLPTSAGITPQDYCDMKKLNDQGIIACIINYANMKSVGSSKGYINPLEYNPLKAGLHAYRSISVLETAAFLQFPATLMGISYGGMAALETLTEKFEAIATKDLINKNPFSLVLVAGALPLRQSSDSVSKRKLVVAYHGAQDSYCLPPVITNYACHSKLNIMLYLVEYAGHLFHYDPELKNYLRSYPHHRDVIINDSNITFKVPSASYELNTKETLQFKHIKQVTSLTYRNLPQVSYGTHILPNLDTCKIPETFFYCLMQGQNVELQKLMKEDGFFAKTFSIEEDNQQFTLQQLIVKIQQAFPVELLAINSYDERRSSTSDTIIDLIPYKDHEIIPCPNAGTWMRKSMVKFINEFTGFEWQDEQYNKRDELTSKINKQNIHLVKFEDYEHLRSDSITPLTVNSSFNSGSYLPISVKSPRAIGTAGPITPIDINDLQAIKISVYGSKKHDVLDEEVELFDQLTIN